MNTVSVGIFTKLKTEIFLSPTTLSSCFMSQKNQETPYKNEKRKKEREREG